MHSEFKRVIGIMAAIITASSEAQKAPIVPFACAL
jgi:hypothetical protein